MNELTSETVTAMIFTIAVKLCCVAMKLFFLARALLQFFQHMQR